MSNTDLLTGNPVDTETDAPNPPRELDTVSPADAAKRGPGRPRAQTRGRPASRPQAAAMPAARPSGTMTDPALEPETMADYEALAGTLTRQTRGTGNNTFDIPQKGRIPGWDYQWIATHIMGAEVDSSEMTNWEMGGWIDAKPQMFPTLCPRGWQRQTIDRQGMRLKMRPMRLTEQAIAETEAMAFERKQSALARAAAGESGREFAPRRNEGLSVAIRPLLE